MKRRLFLLFTAIAIGTVNPGTVQALSPEQKKVISSGVLYFNVEQTPLQNACAVLIAGQSNIFNATQLQQIEANRPFYEQAAEQVDIPWQMIATIHMKESGLGRSNPANGQGVYQFVNKNGGPYPTGPVSDDEFLRQTILAAEFIRGKLGSNLEGNRQLTASGGTPDTIKDTFFSYNGRSSAYANQAAALGFNKETQPFEGSPYVMNKADPQRDPAINKTTWGQIKRDFGPIEYPANNFYGAYITYAALAGTGTGNCDQQLANRIVEIAKQELATGANEADGSYLKYTNNVEAEWCAYFVSWVLEQAGSPFEGGSIPQVEAIRAYATERGWYHDRRETGFKPQPGDLVIYRENLVPFPSHVNIVISYDEASDKITTIGGNELDTVSQATLDRTLPAISGFVRIEK